MAARPLVTKQPNDRLQALLQEAGCSNAGMARRVNLCGAEHGLRLRYDKTSVARWLHGQQPRGRAPGVIAEALGRKLGRTVTVDDIGMADARSLVSAAGLRFAATVPEAVEQAGELWRNDAGRQDFLKGSVVAYAGLVGPSRDWLITAPDGEAARTGGVRVGMTDVAAVREAVAVLSGLDHRYGSGRVRSVVVHYLNTVVSGLLRGSYPEAVGRALFAAASRLTELAGYTAVDTGRPGLAQRYYIQALRLAQAADDRGYGGYVLAAGMSHLAASLGNPREIAQLARAAQEGARGRITPRAEAMFAAAEARGHARTGDARFCREMSHAAEAAMDRAESTAEEEPCWIAHFDRAYLADELAHCQRDLKHPREAASWAAAALAGHPAGRVRRRAIGTLLLAGAQAEQRELELACHSATKAVELLSTVRSQRGAEYLTDFRQRLEPFAQSSAVRHFTARVEIETVR